MFKRIVVLRGAAPLALVSMGAALTLSGCTAAGTGTGAVASAGSSVSAAPGASGNSTAAAGQTAPAGAGASTGAGAGSGGGAAASDCLLSGLSVQLNPELSSSTAAIVAQPVTLTNKGSSACTVLGWPGVAALDVHGNQAFQAIRIGSETSKITLQPGAEASAMLYTVPALGAPGGGGPVCEPIPNLLVTPPNETHSQQVVLALPVCVAPALSALVPGSGTAAPNGAAAFAEAKGLWQAGAPAISANQGAYWSEAGNVLDNAVSSGASGTSGYSTAGQELAQLASLPDAMQTSAQNAEYHSDITALNSFFGTPGLYN